MNPKVVITLPLNSFDELSILAKSKGLSPATLSRIFIVERIAKEKSSATMLAEWSQK